MRLDAVSLRVLGALMEKEMTTPDTYPLSVNSLMAACNQKSSREPVMEVAEDEVRQALHVLEGHELVAAARDGGRVARYEHRIRTVLALRRDETALMCLLLLRGAQTVGELRGRADRMFEFDGLDAVQGTLERLAGRETPLVVLLPRSAGAREARWGHLLGDAAQKDAAEQAASAGAGGATGSRQDRVSMLEERVRVLEERLTALERATAGE